MSKPQDHWNRHARQWDRIGSPLRPAPEDIRQFEHEVECWYAQHGTSSPPAAALLGVTPEITLMRWPYGTSLVAIEHSQAMIRSVWRGAQHGYHALCAEWLAMPLRDGSRDIVVGDGCYNMLTNGSQYRALTREIRRVMRGHGMLLMRFFIRPEAAEPVASVLDDLLHGRIGNFHIFKWRLAMALHGSLDEGVRLSDVWDTWNAAVPDPAQLARRLGWPLNAVLTIDAYRGVATRYTFPTLAEARAAVADVFSEAGCVFPRYELGERCPTLVLCP